MGSKYSSTSVISYNASPPSDDGSTASTNQVKWATIKTKLSDPLNTFASNINSALVTAFDYSMRSVTSADSTVAGDHMRTLEVPSSVTTTFTISLADAATMTNGYIVRVRNSSAVDITVGRASAGDTIDGTAGNVTLPAKSTAIYAVNASANGYDTISYSGTLNASKVQGTWTAASTWTLPALTLGGTVTLNGQSFSGTCANGGTFTTIDINGGTIDGVTIGGSSAAAATVTTLTASGLIKREAAGAVAIIANSTDAGTTAAAGGSFSFQSNGTYNGTFGSYATVTGAGTNQSVMLQAHTNDVYVNAATAGKHIYGQIGGATVTDTSSSGLAVTGTLSATASGQNILNLVSTDPTGGYIAILRGATANAIIGAYSAASGGGTTINADALFLRGFQGIGFGGGSAAVDVFLDTSGNLLVGTTSATDTSKLHVYHTGATQPAALLKNDAGSGAPTAGVWNSATSGDNSFVNFYSDAGATLRGSIDYNRAGGAVRYNTSSDARLKLDLGIVISTDILRSTIIHDFQWKGTEARARGVFAQEAYLVNPNAVKKGDDGDTVKEMWQVDYSKYVPDLIVGWQQHERDITAVKSALSQLGVTLQ